VFSVDKFYEKETDSIADVYTYRVVVKRSAVAAFIVSIVFSQFSLAKIDNCKSLPKDLLMRCVVFHTAAEHEGIGMMVYRHSNIITISHISDCR